MQYSYTRIKWWTCMHAITWNFRGSCLQFPQYPLFSRFRLPFSCLLLTTFRYFLLYILSVVSNNVFVLLQFKGLILIHCKIKFWIILIIIFSFLLGLKLNLFIEQSQYIPELSDTAGARVVIHDQGQMPFPNNEGYSVLPSRSTSFGIRRVRRKVAIFG